MSRYSRDPVTGVETLTAGNPTIADMKNLMLDLCYPIGSMYISTINTSPATFLGGTWISHSGYVLRGATSGVVSGTQGQTNDGGADSVTVSSVANHNHTQNAHSHPYGTGSSTFYLVEGGSSIAKWTTNGTDTMYQGVTQNTTATNIANGSNYTVNTLPKYKNVYIWERTA